MEHAPLRPVPARPAGPVDPATAVRELGAWLPTLPPLAAEALALVVLSERPRAEVAGSLGVSEEELAKLLATARKELRQTVITLGGSGWCERAEGLISDRLDGILADRDTRRLDVHLRNCPRCVEHERRLVQATDALVGGVTGAARGPTPAGEAAPLGEATPPDDGVEPPDDGVEGGIPPVEAAPPDDGIEGGPAEAARPDDSTDAAAAEAAPTREQVAAAAEVLVASRTRRQVVAALAWNSLVALAILLTLATIALTIAGILGAKL
jgi:Putative zinc-finger